MAACDEVASATFRERERARGLNELPVCTLRLSTLRPVLWAETNEPMSSTNGLKAHFYYGTSIVNH